MRIDILTLFPNMFSPLFESILGKAIEKKLLEIVVSDIREFSLDKHKRCDDTPFGGGSGMVMTPQPIYSAVTAIDPDHKAHRIYMSPKGKTLTAKMTEEIAQKHERILILCGHYEGVDQRVLDLCFDEEISIGDYILTGGELPAMVLVDCVARHKSGVLGNEQSAQDESFSNGLLEYPQYTRPQEFLGVSVPEVLLSGHHKNIKEWRESEAKTLTKKRRPDILKEKE